ncbi:MAG: hypothetical protein PHW04_16080 [Candidatus Wallbacteria bacterium]|nr:hypothetical protein [Candidatus Wallbacteria bacterium]
MKYILIFLVLQSAAWADFSKAHILYVSALSLLEKGEIDNAVSTYQQALNEDISILQLKDNGLAKFLLDRLEKSSNPFTTGKTFYLYGYSDKAQEYFEKVLAQFPPASSEYQDAKFYLSEIDAQKKPLKPTSEIITGQSDSGGIGAQPDEELPEDEQEKPARQPQQPSVGKYISQLKQSLDDLRQLSEQQDTATKKAEEEHKKWFGLHYGGYGDYFNMEEFSKIQYEKEKAKSEELARQVKDIEDKIEQLETAQSVEEYNRAHNYQPVESPEPEPTESQENLPPPPPPGAAANPGTPPQGAEYPPPPPQGGSYPPPPGAFYPPPQQPSTPSGG